MHQNEDKGDGKDRLRQRIKNDFTFHPPRDDADIQVHEAIRQQGFAFASMLVEVLPQSRELSLALTKIEEATMHANAALARSRGSA